MTYQITPTQIEKLAKDVLAGHVMICNDPDSMPVAFPGTVEDDLTDVGLVYAWIGGSEVNLVDGYLVFPAYRKLHKDDLQPFLDKINELGSISE